MRIDPTRSNGLRETTFVKCEQILTIARTRLIGEGPLGRISTGQLRQSRGSDAPRHRNRPVSHPADRSTRQQNNCSDRLPEDLVSLGEEVTVGLEVSAGWDEDLGALAALARIVHGHPAETRVGDRVWFARMRFKLDR